MSIVRAYNSPVRDQKMLETREAILLALYQLMSEDDAAEDIAMDMIAQRAGVQRRTIFRHFPAKADLLSAFWPWLNARIGANVAPQTLADLLDGPKTAFAKFDAHDSAMRAALHSATGREMRLGTVAERRVRFAAALAPATAALAPKDRARVEALAHLLYSASAWEALKDYGGLTGAQAGEAASWALRVILSAATMSLTDADQASQTKENRDED
ncbi:MAG: TetR/AcrR family transcriptional regulator [Cypionkella sp.]